MMESHPGVGAVAGARLEQAGHRIVRCNAPDHARPCRGLTGDDACPLDEPVDVAVLVREPGSFGVEHGVVCASRERVPLVELAGAHDPLAAAATATGLASVLVTDGDDVVAACERAAVDGRGHVRAVERRLLQLGVLTPAEVLHQEDVRLRIDRSARRLRLVVELSDGARSREAEIVRAAAQALRDHDRAVAVIDVVVHPLERPAVPTIGG